MTSHIEPHDLAGRILSELHTHANPDNVAGMARYGISPVGTLGVTMPIVRGLARDAKRELRKDKPALHEFAALLWASGVHEARILATVVDVPELLSRNEAEERALDLDSWDTCDQLCGNLLWRTSFAWELPADCTSRPETFVKRAGFVVAVQLFKVKPVDDTRYLPFLDLIERHCTDERNDVKKGVNWALRQIGKNSPGLNAAAIETAERILAERPDSKAARWIARDALRELRSDAVRTRLGLLG
ncbi:MAG: DNA alkylation repair protein [Actinobacteria bacterium]|nr:MAG: DNA alkylation repair protein [Actinomycetota bacterium]